MSRAHTHTGSKLVEVSMEGNEEELQRIMDLLVGGGYSGAQSSAFDKLTAGLSWCITACNVDADIDLFYDNNAPLTSKLKVCEAIEWALQKMECPHRLHAHQIQDLDYSAVYPIVQWLVKRVVLTTQGMFGDQVFSPGITKGCTVPVDSKTHTENETPPSPVSDGPLSGLCNLKADQEHTVIESQQLEMVDAKSCEVSTLLKRIAEEERTNEILLEQKSDLAAQIMKTEVIRKNQDKEESELLLEIKTLKEMVEKAGVGELLKKLLPLLEQSKSSQEEELSLQSSSEQKHKELLMTIENLETYEKHSREREYSKAEVENLLQQDFMRLKLIREDMAKKNQNFVLLCRKLSELPSQSELMQYERCFVELYLHIQTKLQETRNYFGTFNALAEANELTLKEISLLNSINAQFQEVTTSQEGRSKFVASLSNIAKGVSQKAEKVEARFLAEQNSLSKLKKKHWELLAERRRYENLMQCFREECWRNELRSSNRQNA